MKEIGKQENLTYKEMQLTILTACRTDEVLEPPGMRLI